MKACILHKVGNLRCERIHRPTTSSNDVLVRVGACGVCGSDIQRVFSKGVYRYPTIPGHEFAGTVESAGAHVAKQWIGVRVAVFPLIPCRHCEACEIGAYAQCSDYDYLGSRCDGAFAEFVAAPALNLVPLPETVSMEEGAMLEPAAIALHAVRLGAVKAGDTVLILGAGPIGLLAAQWARIHGAAHIILADIDESKFGIAESLGFTSCFNPSKQEVAACVRTFSPLGAMSVIEGTGASEALEQAIQSARPFGTVVLLGNPSGNISLSQHAYSTVLRNELRLKGSWNSVYARLAGNDWHCALSHIESGQLQVFPLISHRCSLEELFDHLKGMRDRAFPYMKVMVTFQ